MHCWRCDKSNHTKNKLNFPKKKEALYMKKSKLKIKIIKVRNISKKKKMK